MKRYTAGQKVQFRFRGTPMEGTIIRQRTIRRRKKKRDLARLVSGDASSLDSEVVEISVEGKSGYCQVPIDAISKVIGKGDANEARAKKHAVQKSRNDHANSNWEKAHEKGLTTLDDGDSIKVQFRGGTWRTATFLGFVRPSYNVRFRVEGESKKRTCSPDFVKIN